MAAKLPDEGISFRYHLLSGQCVWSDHLEVCMLRLRSPHWHPSICENCCLVLNSESMVMMRRRVPKRHLFMLFSPVQHPTFGLRRLSAACHHSVPALPFARAELLIRDNFSNLRVLVGFVSSTPRIGLGFRHKFAFSLSSFSFKNSSRISKILRFATNGLSFSIEKSDPLRGVVLSFNFSRCLL